MASSGQTSSLNRRRILANAQVRKTGQTPETPAEEDTDVAAKNEDAERMPSQPVKGKKTKRKKSPGRSTTQVVLLAIIGIGGIAAILGLRYLSEMVGNNWIGN